MKTNARLEPVRSFQARGRPEEAAREVRALLDFLRDNQAAVQEMSATVKMVLNQAINLKILDPVLGEKELARSVAVELVKLSPHLGGRVAASHL